MFHLELFVVVIFLITQPTYSEEEEGLCYEEFLAAMEEKFNNVNTAVTTKPTVKPVNNNQNKYKLKVTDKAKTFVNTKKLCAKMYNGSLVSKAFSDKEKAANYIGELQTVIQDIKQNVWIGLEKKSGNSVWLDGNSFSFTEQSNGLMNGQYPIMNNQQEELNEGCWFINTAQHKLDVAKCNAKYLGICEIKKVLECSQP